MQKESFVKHSSSTLLRIACNNFRIMWTILKCGAIHYKLYVVVHYFGAHASGYTHII